MSVDREPQMLPVNDRECLQQTLSENQNQRGFAHLALNEIPE